MSKLTDALAKLDPMNDNHWTSDGLPRIDTVKFMAGDPTLTREMITAEAPDFTRQAMAAYQAAQATPPVVPETPAVPDPIVATAQAVAVAVTAPVVTEAAAVVVEPETVAFDYDAAISQAQTVLQEAITFRNEAQERVASAQNALDDLINSKHESGAAESTMDVIQGYLQSQANVLQERARRAQVLRDSGVTLEDIKNLIPQASPLDQALARKR